MLIDNKLINLNLEAENWELALEKTCNILEKNGYINSDYKKKLISLTKEIGPYYIITKNIAIPHLRPEEGVLKQGFSFFRFNKSVKFDGNKNVNYFIYILSLDNDCHIDQVSYIANLIDDEEFFKKINEDLIGEKEIYEYINKGGY
ncbi:PTS sugar transporter subunit IIA [Oceanivirga salmonicida]|uniref:PTS sugar transporter subunit IIA n=1 Tax=Oceanivirga salmonicida TaxID=1769291 RepID=UPI000836B0E5|nr:PTS sugar transporter subunit IIA [Oceanivirga salmonicida]